MLGKAAKSALLFGATMLVSSLMTTDVAFGHGWVTSPPSRQDHCRNNRTPFDCGAVKYEPQSVEAPKGAMSCHGGSSFTILNNDWLAWPVTSIGSTATFNWYCTACHRTLNWEYFVDGSLRATISGNNSQPSQNVSHTISGLPSGRHKILARWNIGDTPMAFYSCIDVNIGGGGGGTPTPTNPPRATATPTNPPRGTATPTNPPRATPTPTSGGGGGTWAPNTFYSTGATVTYGGLGYRCLQAHTSLVGWEPPNVPALWARQ
jgi:predicted carbohydrate-binding protein with CBM5 and CBM33 domain